MGKRLGRRANLGVVSILLLGGTAWTAPLDGPTVYEGACESCHGADGRGSPEGMALTVPLPGIRPRYQIERTNSVSR